MSIRRIASGALQREQQEAAHDGEVFVEMRHVGPARGSLHVPEIMGGKVNKDEVDDERIGHPARLEAGQDRQSADQLNRCDQIAEPCRRCHATRDDAKEMFERALIEVEPGVDIGKRQIAVNDEHGR